MSKYAQFFAIINKHGLDYKEVVLWFSDGRTSSLSSLPLREYNELLRIMQQHNGIPPGDGQRKKLIAIARSMQWGTNSRQIVLALDNWLLKQKYRKKLMQHTEAELNVMVTIFENKVYAGYLAALNP